MRRLDPRIHEKSLLKWMDCRVKPGNDGADSLSRPLRHAPRKRGIQYSRTVLFTGSPAFAGDDREADNRNQGMGERKAPCLMAGGQSTTGCPPCSCNTGGCSELICPCGLNFTLP